MTEIELSPDDFQAFLRGLREHDDRLERLAPGERPAEDEVVDAYVFSGHVEALNAADIDEDVWETLDDLDLNARDEAEAWRKIKAWYAERDCVLLRVGADEYIVGQEVARRLGLLA